jgi:hypothetical protein
MSAASLLKVYDGEDPELAFQTAAPPGTPDLAEVLAAGASANAVPITDAGDITGNTAADLTIGSGAGHGLILAGAVGASLTATTGGCKVEASDGVLELNWNGTGGQLNLVSVGAQLTDITSTAAGAKVPNYSGATKQLQIKVAGTDYWIALNPVAFA